MVHCQTHFLMQIQVTKKWFAMMKWIDQHGFCHGAQHTHNSVHLCAHTQPQCLPTYAQKRPRNHDDDSSRSSPYWLKRSLIFSSVARQSANDMFQLLPPRTAAMASYHPPGENMRRRRRRCGRRDRWPGTVTASSRSVRALGANAVPLGNGTRRMHKLYGL